VYDGYTKAEACIAGEALDRKSERRSCVDGLRKCDIQTSGDGISRNLSVELHIVQRQVYDCYTTVKRQRRYTWPVQRETGSPHWQSFEITRKLSLMWSLPRNSCVVVVVNGSFDAGLCVVIGGVAKLEVSEGVRALDRNPHARWVEIMRSSNLPSLMTLKIKNHLVGWGLVRHIWMLTVRLWSVDGSERRN